MSRFAFPKKYAIRPIKDGKGKALCFATVIDTELGIEFRDVRLVAGSQGEFVSAPFRSYEDKEGVKQFSEFWRCAYNEETNARYEHGAKYLAEMAKAVGAQYRLYLADNGGSGDDEPRRPAETAAPRRSARGPVPTVADGEAPTNRLPF